jgi:hypothetical protein
LHEDYFKVHATAKKINIGKCIKFLFPGGWLIDPLFARLLIRDSLPYVKNSQNTVRISTFSTRGLTLLSSRTDRPHYQIFKLTLISCL